MTRYNINYISSILAAGLGFEPRYTAPEAVVLPLDDPAKMRQSRNAAKNSRKSVMIQFPRTAYARALWYYHHMNKLIALIVLVLLIGAGAYFYLHSQPATAPAASPQEATSSTQAASSTPAVATTTVLGTSVQGRTITAYNFGTGPKKILFVGGIHGGYEWNTVLIAYQLMDYLAQNPSAIPAGVQVVVVPVLNPDGLTKVVKTDGRFTAADVPSSLTVQISGRYNANTVDLNRNFDCDWKAKGVWQNKPVSGGASVFSEPESQAMKQYIEGTNPAAVVVWYSSAGGVYSSACDGPILPETTAITNAYAQAAGYPAHQVFNNYDISGDMVNWLASKKIPAISVLLTNHTDTEWDKNLAGITAILQHYAQ